MTKIDFMEVGPRDGFQNVKDFIPLEEKLKIIDGIAAAGVKIIQHTSFVHPKAIPQLKDAKEVTKYCLEKYPNIEFFALVPNLFGAKTAFEMGLKKVSYVVSLSESHNKANINRTHEESLNELAKIMEAYPELYIVLDLATTFGCPFEGKVGPDKVVEFIKRIYDMGIKEFDLCDTIGVANPKQVREVISAVREAFPDIILQVHIHDTRNMGIACTLAAIECGVVKVQATLGGLGGCPFAPGASGNTASEDLIYALNEMGYDTGVDFEKLLEIAKYEKTVINGNFSSHQINIGNN